MQIAFHTPLNLFDDGGVSGDRRMARQLVAALESLGHRVDPVGAGRDYLRSAERACLDRHRSDADRLRDRLLAAYASGTPRPELWFTYHNYYRAPDLLGPGIAAALDIPYVTAEASDSDRRSCDEWSEHTVIVRHGLTAGDVHFYFTDRDRQGLEPWRRPGTALLELPPFITFERAPPQRRDHGGPPRLITIAMMREGTKQNSYLALARIVARIPQAEWRMSIVGDGRQRAEIEQAFSGLPRERIDWLGLIPREQALDALAQHDVFVWPGVREAYGLVYLEAQAVGLPVIAFDSGGVAATVTAGTTALLAPEGDEAAFAGNLLSLLQDRPRRERMGAAARRFVLEERTGAGAAAALAAGLDLAYRHHRDKRAADGAPS